MKRVWICLPLLLCTVFLGVVNAEDDEKAEARPRRAAAPEGAVKVRWEWPVTIEFKGTPIREAITKVAVSSGVHVVIGPKVKGTVTLYAKDMRVIDVLRAIGIQDGHRVILKDGIVHITGPSAKQRERRSGGSNYKIAELTGADTNAAIKRRKLKAQLDHVAAQLETLRVAAAKARAGGDADAVRRTDDEARALAEKLAKIKHVITRLERGKQKPIVVRLDNAFKQGKSERMRVSDELLAKAEYYMKAGKHELAAEYTAKAKALMQQARNQRVVEIKRKVGSAKRTPLVVEFGGRRLRKAPAANEGRQQMERLRAAYRALKAAGLGDQAEVVEREMHEHEMHMQELQAEGRGPRHVLGEIGALRREVKDLRKEVKELTALVRRLVGANAKPVSRRRR